MNRSQAMEHFEQNTVIPRVQDMLQRLESYYQLHKSQLAQSFWCSIEQIIAGYEALQEQGQQAALGYITFSLLRTSMLSGQSLYLVEASNRLWFLDEQAYSACYDASWAYGFLKPLEAELLQLAKKYAGAIDPTDVQRRIMHTAAFVHQYVLALARYTLRLHEDKLMPALNRVRLERECEIRVGEYRDLSEIVYKVDRRERSAEELGNELSGRHGFAYSGEVFRHAELSQGDYTGIHLYYSDLRGSSCKGSLFTNGYLVGSRWDEADLCDADFSGAFLAEASFTGADLRDASFRGCVGMAGLLAEKHWERPGYEPVCFTGANLAGADFTGAWLPGADFRGALHVDEAMLHGAWLEGAQFSSDVSVGLERMSKVATNRKLVES
ncbi:pentapeptide repeat-containing protein [Paenibacillus sp. FSL K6-1230]|uniref:pentapeptide repeat-containing protein n=1 Tax=Paenibacillus sp. FSL K6-1230 TaxID=2921603 RepID=UPI0030F8F023